MSAKRNEIMDRMLDPNREDYGIRVGRSQYFVLRGSARLKELFPDGCKASVERDGQRWAVVLLNRVSGYNLMGHIKGKPDITGFILKNAGMEDLKALPEFGAVSPDVVQKIPGGLRLVLPLDLPSVRVGGQKVAAEKKKALPVQPPEAPASAAPPEAAAPPAAQAAPAPASKPKRVRVRKRAAPVQEDSTQSAPATAAPLEPVRSGTRPETSLLTTIQTLNQWKRYLGADLSLTVLGDGRVEALARYE